MRPRLQCKRRGVTCDARQGIATRHRRASQVKPLLAAFLSALTPLTAQTMVDGSAIVTSRSGSVSATDASGKRISLDAHDVLLPAELQISTNEDAQIFLTLSNGVALALDESTLLQCASYTQRPFDLEDQSLGLEPSVSDLQIRFIKGQLAVASNRLSPLSELRIQLPEGELRLHKGTCLISLEATGLHITAYDGNLTYYYPSGESREFVSAPKRVRISKQSVQRQQIAEASTVDSLEAEQVRFTQAAQHASKRVTFQPNMATRLPPVPVLIVRPQYFQQLYFRPYQFED